MAKEIVEKTGEVTGYVEKNEIVELKNEVAELKLLLKQFVVDKSNDTNKTVISNDSEIKNNADDGDDNDGDIIISSDSYIKVMSLTPYRLTLTTQEHGKGKKFDFNNFGEVKRILYRDLIDIMEQHPNFLLEGYYLILNKDVVRKHGLNDAYEKILNKQNIEKILNGNQSDAVNMFKTCSPRQRDLIASMIIDKMIRGEFVDLNLLDRLSRIVDYNIAERGEEIKKVSKLNEK